MQIAIVGLGAAGMARKRAAEALGYSVQIVSRHCSSRTWPEVLADPAVEAVAISTENTLHGQLVGQALRAGKHVLVDYPLATEGKPSELIALAREEKRVLHVEHIGLLMESHKMAKGVISQLGPIQHGEYRHTGGWNDRFFVPQTMGPWPLLLESRLLQVGDLCGAFSVESLEWVRTGRTLEVNAELSFACGGRVQVMESRADGKDRARAFNAQFGKGSFSWPAATETGDLFAQDLQWFARRVETGCGPYYDESAMVGILESLIQPWPGRSTA